MSDQEREKLGFRNGPINANGGIGVYAPMTSPLTKVDTATHITEALERFYQAAKSWGWQEDQGYNGEDMRASFEEYEASKAALLSLLNTSSPTQGEDQ